MSFRSLKNSLPIFLRMVARKLGVRFLIQGTIAGANEDLVVVPYGDFNDPQYCKQVLGMTVHEGGHLLFTDMTSVLQPPTDHEQKADPTAMPRHKFLKWMDNAVEDARMECRVIDKYPGARQVLFDCVESIKDDPQWFADVTDGDSPLSALQGYVLFRLRAEVLEQPLLNKAMQAERVLRSKIGDDLVDKITEKMFEVRTAQSSKDSLRIATDILALVDDQIQAAEPPPPAQAGDQGDQSDGSGSQGSGQGGDSSDQGDAGDGASSPQAGSEGDSSGNSDSSSGQGKPKDAKGSGKQGDDASSKDPNASGSSKGDNGSDDSSNDGHSGGTKGGTGFAEALKQLLSGEDTGRIADLSEAFKNAVEKAAEDYQDQTGDTGGYMHLTSDIEDAQNNGDFSSLLSSIQLSTNRLSGQLQSLLEASTEDAVTNVHVGRMVDIRGMHRIFNGSTDVFLEERESPQVDTNVVILLDRSGSMSRQLTLAQQCVASAALAVEKVQDANVCVAAFPGERTNVIRLTKSGESVRRTLGRYVLRATGGTPTAEALWWAASELIALGAERNIVILCSDGEPNAPEQAQNIIRMLRRSDIEVVGVGIGEEGTRATRSLLYGVDACGIRSIDQLAQELFGVLRRKLVYAEAA